MARIGLCKKCWNSKVELSGHNKYCLTCAGRNCEHGGCSDTQTLSTCSSCGSVRCAAHLRSQALPSSAGQANYCHNCMGSCNTCNTLGLQMPRCAGCGASVCDAHVTPLPAGSGNKLCQSCIGSCVVCSEVVSSRCSACNKHGCSSHLVRCETCAGPNASKLLCAECAAVRTCSRCPKLVCPSHVSCTTCKISLCPKHVCACTTCGRASEPRFCDRCSPRCASCGLHFCAADLPYHCLTKSDKQELCVNQKRNYLCEGPWTQGKDGVSTFVWPNGQRTMCLYAKGQLILSERLSANDVVSAELIEERHKMEALKEQQQKQLAADKAKHEEQLRLYAEAEKLKVAEERKQLEEFKTNEREKIAQERAEFEEEKRQAQQFVEAQRGVVKLDVGGTTFKTTVTTLTNQPSMLQTMFNGTFKLEKTDDGAVFIDRNGQHFANVLEFLRNGALPSALTPKEMAALQVEADYFQMESLAAALKQ